MSKGLGKIQRKIIEIVKQDQDDSYGITIADLVMKIYHPERFDPDTGDCEDWEDWSYSQAEYIATHMTVSKLEKRGLIKTKMKKTGQRERSYVRDKSGKFRGGTSRIKIIPTSASEKRDLEIEEKKRNLMVKYGL